MLNGETNIIKLSSFILLFENDSLFQLLILILHEYLYCSYCHLYIIAQKCNLQIFFVPNELEIFKRDLNRVSEGYKILLKCRF
jgi:hypothetical protein